MNIQPIKAESPITTSPLKTPPKPAPSAPAADVFQPQQNEQLQNALAAEPEIRADAVARGRTLAADSGYPFGEVLTGIAERILGELASYK